nr:hypothetical protein [Tanacetum cinerariifolium]
LNEDITLASKQALREMIDFLMKNKGLSKDDAYMLCSVAGDLNLTQSGLCESTLLARQELADVVVQELRIGGVAGGAGGVAPQRWNGQQLHARNESCFGLFHVAAHAGRGAHVVVLPGAHLGNEVVGVGPGDEVRAVVIQHLLEGGVGLFVAAPQLFAPPLLREKPARPDGGEGFEALGGRRGVVTIVESGIGGEGRNLALEAHHAVRIVFGRA